MVLPVTNTVNILPTPTPHRPILNSIPMMTRGITSRLGGFSSQYTQFWRYYKQTPALLSVINVVITDIIGERPTFVTPDGTALGKTKRRQAERFWRENRGKETMKAVLADMAVTGDGYGWKGKLSKEKQKEMKEQLKEEISRELTKQGRFNFYDFKELRDTSMKALDEDLKRPKSFDYIAASTVQMESDSFDILTYIQRANGLTVEFTPKEVLHFRWQTLDGKIEGFSPLEALIRQLSLLWFVDGNMVAFMENGGSPGKLITAEDTQPGQPAFDRLFEQIQSMKDVRNRHSTYLGSGKITVQDLDLMPKDMEYETLSLYITSNIAFAYGIPVTRIPFLIGKSASKGDSGGMAEQGYWNMISEKQDMIEDILNFQLFEEMGWHIRLNRKYKQDEVREAQTLSMNTDSVQKMQGVLRQNGLKLDKKKVIELLQLTQEEVEEDDSMELEFKQGLMGQNQLDNTTVNSEPAALKKNDTKRNVANAAVNKGAAV